MASTYTNDLRLELIAVGEGAGSAPNDWGSKTNVNLTQIASAFGPGTENLSSDADVTLTLTDGTADAMKALYLKVTSGVNLTAPRVITIAPNTIAKLWFIENATAGGQSIVISQGSGGNVTVTNSSVKVVYSDGAGSGAAVVDALVDLDLSGTTTADTLSTTNFTLGGTAVSSTGAELNILDGVTSTTSELNILDGVTATTAELNYLDIAALGTSAASKAVTADGNGVVRFSAGIAEKVVALTSGTTVALDINDGTIYTITLGHNIGTFNWSNPGAGSGFILKITQDGTGGRSITWPTGVKWAGDVAPTLSAAANAVDVFTFFHVTGTVFYGFTAGQVMS